MEKKIIFLDVDGTLVGDDGHIPHSAKEACVQARKNGHLVYLCTGRSKAEIYDFILETGFDGIIGAGGGFVEIDNDMLFHKKVSEEDVKHMVDYFHQYEIPFYLESNGGLYASENLLSGLQQCIHENTGDDPALREKMEEHSKHFVNSLVVGEKNLYRNDVNKACFLESKSVPFAQIKKEFEEKFGVIQCTVPLFGKDSGELTVPNVHKAMAIETLIHHLGISKEQTIGIGDGMNDAEMLEFCAVGIAMGNAKADLKKIADDITDSVDNDGIYNSFKKYQLI